jgi:hypothetical protein
MRCHQCPVYPTDCCNQIPRFIPGRFKQTATSHFRWCFTQLVTRLVAEVLSLCGYLKTVGRVPGYQRKWIIWEDNILKEL